MAKAESPKSTGFFAFLERTASVGTLIKTLFGFVIAMVATSIAVYQHFAKSSELQDLQCAVVDQSTINNQVIRTAHEVRSALNALKSNLEMKDGSPTSSKVLADELSKAIGNIQVALDKIEDSRAKTQNESIKRSRKC